MMENETAEIVELINTIELSAITVIRIMGEITLKGTIIQALCILD